MPPVKINTASKHMELTQKGFAALLYSAADAIVIADSGGSVLNFNRAAQTLFGYQIDEVMHQNIKILMPDPYHDEHDGYMQNYQKTGEKKIIGIGRQVHALKKDGTIFPILLSVGEYSEDNDHYYIGMIRDLTIQLRTEQQAKEFRDRLAHVERITTMGEMVSGIAHELNQPLSAISSYVQAAQRRIKGSQADPEKMMELLSKVEAQALRAGKVIERMRSLSKVDDMVRDRVRVNDVVREAVDLIRAEATIRGVDLQTEYMPQNHEVIVDSVQIQQVILNLLRNAIDATEETGVEKGVVIIRTIVDRGHNIEVVIQDQGGGIPEDIRARLFHPFVTSKSHSTGLGLSISRSIIDAHGGNLIAENIDSGAVFYFTIPMALSNDA